MEEVYVEEFMSPGCVGCPAVKKMLEELKGEFGDQLTVEEVDITVDTTRASQYGVMSVPAIAINGILKFIDVPKKEDLRDALLEEINREE
ncbi:MAG: thioredoxin family protein [Candidatus Aminicenantes bacterium]|nr:thioredoxin family protein [Candidatus Aminicenantes bacterium]HHF52527.1 thioredoxin [Candidatus Aminicenantes bacterium]